MYLKSLKLCNDFNQYLFNNASLTVTNIEEQVIASNLVHETNCIISMPEFALRLQISVDDPVTAELFSIFDPVRYNHLFMIQRRINAILL